MAPVGTNPGDTAAWKHIGWTDASDFIVGDLSAHHHAVDAAAASMAKAAADYSMPSRWVIGIDPAAWDAAVINERSKPMGLTKKHEYESERGNGRKLTIEKSHFDPAGAHIGLHKRGVEESFIWTSGADSIPLALNVLGYDRDDITSGYINEPTTIGGYQANAITPRSKAERDQRVATAIDYLRGADIFDQREVKRKADEEAAAEAAKARAKVAEREIAERFFRKAKEAYEDAIVVALKSETTSESTAKLQSALSSYETARRKFEGLPN